MFALILNNQLKETTVHGNNNFPFAIYRGPITLFEKGYLDWHWHDEFEFHLVTSGELCYCVEHEKFQLHQGEAVFINAKRLHMSPSNSPDQFSNTITFHGRLLCDDLLSDWYQQVIQPLIHSKQNCLMLHPSVPWENAVIQQLQKACEEEECKYHGYELAVKSHIGIAFSEILRQFSTSHPRISAEDEKMKRTRTLLAYIDQNYGNPITLENLADSINLSEGECCRFFKKQLHQTPFAYLNEYRIKRSCDDLIETDWSVSDISMKAGFNSFSYYSKRFYEVMHCTPLEYRKKIQKTK